MQGEGSLLIWGGGLLSVIPTVGQLALQFYGGFCRGCCKDLQWNMSSMWGFKCRLSGLQNLGNHFHFNSQLQRVLMTSIT